MTRVLSSSLFAVALVAVGALASTSASAGPSRDAAAVVVTQAPVRVHVQVEPEWRPRMVREHGPVAMQAARQTSHAQAAGWNDCAAPRWNPERRYMPGDVVRRQGHLYVATGLSAAVWNENSPPEWTPSYWVPAVCR